MPACPHCSRVNPAGALFCFHDGGPLGNAAAGDATRFRFAVPFIFPSGRACWTFDELALACQDDWPSAVELLRGGALTVFLGGIGRPDLAAVAREAARFPDPDRGLDLFLGDLPAQSLQPASLVVSPDQIAFGRLRVGTTVRRELHVVNEGMGFLHGTISSDVPWLVVGEGDGFSNKLFGCLHETTVPVQIRGRALRASLQSQIGKLTIQSSGGAATICVKAEVPPQTFAAGVLAGSRTPRQLAEKARLAPKEAARLFETGAVSRWYQDNGWTYPVEGGSAAGLAAVQQFFDALGLSAPPSLELSESSVSLSGKPGEQVLRTVRLSAVGNRPVYASAVSDQPWLIVTSVDLEGSSAHVHLSVPAIPDRPGELMRANLRITGNGRQKFQVPISLRISAGSPDSVARVAAATMAGASLDWLPFAPDPPMPSPELAETVPDWLTTADSKTALPPLPAMSADNHDTSVLVPAKRRRASEQDLQSRWLILACGILLLLMSGIAGVIVAASLGGKPAPGKDTATDEDSESAAPLATAPNTREKDRSAQRAPGASVAKPPKASSANPPSTPNKSISPGSGTGKRPLAVPEIRSCDVEVVFCIDTTGSMGGLLAGAKAKIWAICNQIASGKPVPHLRVGVVAYRDRGDEYITRITDLSRDLDAVQQELQLLVAAGGGDTPESVNQALDDAVNRIKWSTDKTTLRIVFLVGDAPPHMDYKDDVKYPITCTKAVEKGILINTVQCGKDDDCKRCWLDIAARAGGAYVAIPQGGGVVAMDTPFDEDLALLGQELLKTALIYGDATEKRRGQQMLAAARRLRGAAAADRAAFAAKSKAIGPYDLLDAVKDRRIKLEDIKADQLPDIMKRMRTLAERQTYLDKVAAVRDELQKKAVALEKKRAEVLAARMAASPAGKESFDLKVLEVLRKQARKFDIEY